MRFACFYLLLLLGLNACTPSTETALEGTLLFAERPLAGAQVEVYLRQEKDRSTQPFTAVTTDQQGRYRLELPAGSYYLIGKKKEETEDGRVRMLMGECPTNPLQLTTGTLKVAPFSIKEMGRDGALAPAPETGVRGRITEDGKAVAGAFVYVYTETEAGLMGPSYGAAVRTDADGTFTVGLPAGRFFLAARWRADGSRVGELAIGDLNGSYPGNPVEISLGQTIDLQPFPLTRVEPETRQQRLARGKFDATDTGFTGRVLDAEGKPKAGIYVFAYLDSRMTGKPTYISAPSGADGRYLLHLGGAGTYFLGARSAFGGPLEPGEWIGTYDGDPRHGATAVAGEHRDLGDLTVREVW